VRAPILRCPDGGLEYGATKYNTHHQDAPSQDMVIIWLDSGQAWAGPTEGRVQQKGRLRKPLLLALLVGFAGTLLDPPLYPEISNEGVDPFLRGKNMELWIHSLPMFPISGIQEVGHEGDPQFGPRYCHVLGGVWKR
jgi:hypothetical protein